MATAKKTTINEERVIITPVTRIVLELTEDEAEFLGRVLTLVGGDPETSRRRHQGPISKALYGAGINAFARGGDVSGNITFHTVAF